MPPPLNDFSEKTVVVQANAQKYEKYALDNRNYYRRQKKCHEKPRHKAKYAKYKYTFPDALQKSFYSSATISAPHCFQSFRLLYYMPHYGVALQRFYCIFDEFSTLFLVINTLYSSTRAFTNSRSILPFGVIPLTICMRSTAFDVAVS